MNRIEDYSILRKEIIGWIKNYCIDSNIHSLVVGVSGGIDSAVVSALCAGTKMKTYLVGMPIHQEASQENFSDLHMNELSDKYSNIEILKFDLTSVFESFKKAITVKSQLIDQNLLALANSRSRLRMVTLYQIAQHYSGIVVGTGNKVEDYGIGFYTKYGDGGVDIAPIADLYKTEVYNLGIQMQVNNAIIEAPPTDGLWDDARTDEEQIGATYKSLEWIMEHGLDVPIEQLSTEELNALNIFNNFHQKNKHKMESIPTFYLKNDSTLG